MSKVLITGMSAQQASLNSNNRNLSFAGAVHRALTELGHQPEMRDPRVEWNTDDLKEYDSVIVGVSPITSLSANKAYGALNVIDQLWEDKRLRLMIDAPHPAQVGASLRSVTSTPGNLIKPFYSYRQGYQLASTESVSKRLLGVTERLLNEDWPETFYPSLPWRRQQSVADELPSKVHESLTGINLDSFLVAKKAPKQVDEKVNKWVADIPASNWTRKVQKTLAVPVLPMRTSKGDTDGQVGDQISRSIGALISPHRDGTWWTYRYIQSLSLGVPVATDWKESQVIGKSWSVLAATVEHMTEEQRRSLAWDQLADYMSAVPRQDAAGKHLEDLLGLHSKIGKEAHAV